MWQNLSDFSVLLELEIVFLLLISCFAFHLFRKQNASSTAADTLFYRLEQSISLRLEIICISLIIMIAVITRTAGWDKAISAPFWFSETVPIYADMAIQKGNFWKQWSDLLRHTRVEWLHQSPIMMPVAIAFQLLLGPSIHLPLLAGAFWGVGSVGLAWLLGREAHSKVFALLFASFVAASPLQIVWSRIGGIHIGGGTHVLLVLCCAYSAGKRKSYVLAALSGILAWASLYMYYAARVAIPLSFIALFSGLMTGQSGTLKKIILFFCISISLGGTYLFFGDKNIKETFWPVYGGYVGNKGEKNLDEFVKNNKDEVLRQLSRSIDKYFIRDRGAVGDTNTPFRWGIKYGGLSFLPVTLLGIVGLGYTFIFLKKYFLWVLLACGGLAVTAFSVATARRFVVFDIAWCAYAAFGLITLLNTKWFQHTVTRTARIGIAAFVLGLSLWSFGTIVILNAMLPHNSSVPMPFGDGGFGDGITCLRCLHAGYEWQSEIEKNNFIILFDTDLYRENRTSPGGLPLYGQLAALAAGRKDNFIGFYPLIQNIDMDPPFNGGAIYNSSQTDFASYLISRINKVKPGNVIWHFEKPTQWEQWIVQRLIHEAGGLLSTFETPLSDIPGIRVRTSWDSREQTFHIIRELLSSGLGTGEKQGPECVKAEVVQAVSHPFPMLLTASRSETDGKSPDWLVGSWHTVEYKGETLSSFNTVGAAIEKEENSENEKIHLLTANGGSTVHSLPAKESKSESVPGISSVGFGCAAYIAGHWWIVDPVSGKFTTNYQPNSWIPSENHWIGVTKREDHEVVLASAFQKLCVFDLDRQTVKEFPASVWPSRQFLFGECSPVIAEKKGYATFNHLLSSLYLYDTDGQYLTTLRLDKLLNLGGHWISSIAGSGRYIGIGIRNAGIRTLRIQPSQSK